MACRCAGVCAACAASPPAAPPEPPAPLPAAPPQAGIGWKPAGNGSPVLDDAIAHMECRVKSRMETNDHWICYAEVEDGEVTKAQMRTAVHRRKVASYY